jgi:quercetin dioxygenase-like cupin family protein
MTQSTTANYIKAFDLAEELQHLYTRKPWPKKLTSNTLLKSPDFRIVLIAMEAGASLGEHHNDGRISIHVLEGSVTMGVDDQKQTLSAGQILALDRSIRHDVEALEDSVLLLTVAWPSDRELAEMKHRGYGS